MYKSDACGFTGEKQDAEKKERPRFVNIYNKSYHDKIASFS